MRNIFLICLALLYFILILQKYYYYIETDSRVKLDTNQLQYSLKPTPALLALVQNPTALPSWLGFCTTQQVSVFELSQSAVGFYIIVLYHPRVSWVIQIVILHTFHLL